MVGMSDPSLPDGVDPPIDDRRTGDRRKGDRGSSERRRTARPVL